MQNEILKTESDRPVQINENYEPITFVDSLKNEVRALYITPNNIVEVANWCNGIVDEKDDDVLFTTSSFVEIEKDNKKMCFPVWTYIIEDQASEFGFRAMSCFDFESKYSEV